MDHHSKLLLSLKSNGPSSASEIADVIIGWKNTFSFYWYHQFINDDQKKLDFVFNLLFELTEFPDSNVTIASFNAIGALLVSLSPFRSQELILSFKNTLSSLEVSPNTSCAVIATFVFLSHHVSDNSISHFIESTPIFPHFGADLRTFIHHIPNLIEQMDRLNMEFHQALLRSLISSFGRSPVSSFIESIMLLIKRFPNKLLSDLMEFIESNKLEGTLLSVGGPILNNQTFSALLSIQQKYAFLNALTKKLFISKSESNEAETEATFNFNDSDYDLQTEVTATELEQAVSIICGLKKQSEEELRNHAKTISKSIWNQRGKLKSVFQRILYPFANSIDELRPTKEDSSNEMSRKIMALGYIENANDDDILSICEPFIDSRDECFISVLTFLSKSMKEKCHKLFQKLFEKDDYSWVQRIAILNLIDSMDQFQMETYMSDYNQKCIDFLIKCALSLQTELSTQSRHVISRFISLDNVEFFRDSILKCDFFNFQITKNILMLLNVIVNSISPSPLRCFIGIVLELFDFTLSDIINSDSDDSNFEGINIYPSFVSDCFEFLSHYPGLFTYRKSIEHICMCKMQEVYYSFTQEKLFFQSMIDNSSQNSATMNEAVMSSSQASSMIHSNRKKAQAASQMTKLLKSNVRPILSTITTDVVADASLVRYDFLKPLKNCLQYLVSNQMQSASYRTVFLKLLPIFPMEILPYFYEQSNIISNCMESQRKSPLSSEEIEAIRPKILRIFSSNRDQIVIARCCEFFYQSNIINQQILIQVKKIVENTKIKSSSSAFEFFKLIYSVEPENAMNYLKKLLNVCEKEEFDNKISLPDLTKNELALLSSNFPSVYKILAEMENFSFLQYKTNRFLAKNWFEKNDYTTWPLIDSDLKEEIKKMFDKSYSIHVKDCSLIDNQHWIFLMKNRTLFFRDNIRSYLDSNKYLLKSICIFSIGSEERNHFDFNEKIQKDLIESLDKCAKVLPSTALLVKKGKFVKNEVLIKNFLRFSKIKIGDDLLNKMKEEFPNLESYFNDYTNKIINSKKKNEIMNQPRERIIISKRNEIKDEMKIFLVKEPHLVSDDESDDENDEWINEEKKDENKIDVKEQQLNENSVNTEEQNQQEIPEKSEQQENPLKDEEQQEKKDENQTNREEQNKEQHDENQSKQEEEIQQKSEEQNQEQKEEVNEENQTKQEEQKEEVNEENQTKQEEQKEENNEKVEGQNDEIQVNAEEQKEERTEEQHEELQNKQEEQKEENQTKSEEQHEEVQNKPEETHEENQINQEEPKEEKQEESHEDTQNKQEETQQKSEEQTQQQHENELPKSDNTQQTHEETQNPNEEQNQLQTDKQNENSHIQLAELQNEIQPTPNPEESKQQEQPHPSPQTQVSTSIPDFDPNFPMKSKFLKTLCNHPPKTTVAITMYRMHLINRIGEIKSPKQFLYFLRFLRINLIIPKNSRESLAIRKNTVENFGPIINKFVQLASGRIKLNPSDSDFDFFEEEKDLSFVLLEFVKLSTKLFVINDLHRAIKSVSVVNKTESIELLLISNLVIHSSKFRNMINNVFSVSNNLLTNYSIHQLKSSLLSRVPSILSFIITNIKKLPDEESSMFFMRHYKTLLEDEIVSDLAIEFLSFYLNQNQGAPGQKNYEEFFDGNTITQIALQLFDTKRSIFKKAGEKGLIQTLFTLIKGQFKNNLIQFMPLIEKLSVCGYSLPFTIDLVTAYFQAVAFNIFQIPVTPNHIKMMEILEKQQNQKKGKQKQILSDELKRQNLLSFQKDFGIKEIRIVQSIFLACPSISNALKLGKTLISAAAFFDSLALIFGKLAPFEDCPFSGIFCIAKMFFVEFINDFEKKRKFVDLVMNFEKQNSSFNSRARALKILIEKDEIEFDLAFAVACLETNDDDKIEEVINLFNE